MSYQDYQTALRDQAAQLKLKQAALEAQQKQAAQERKRAIMTMQAEASRLLGQASSAPPEIARALASAVTNLQGAIAAGEGLADRLSRSFQHATPEQRAALVQQAQDSQRANLQAALQQAKEAAKAFKVAMIDGAVVAIAPKGVSETALLDAKADVREALIAGKKPAAILREALEAGDMVTAHILTSSAGRAMLALRSEPQGPLKQIVAEHLIGQQKPLQYGAPVQADSAVRLALGNDLDNFVSQAQSLGQ